ncbi:hypothetical protein, partial [Brevundimonas sp.]|uniref:hypothetical protein n=1 Tax=Brevundimonas sp. TaxID=1871086 RepID=UPI002FCC4902
LNHNLCCSTLQNDLRTALIDSRSAYRILDNQTVSAIGTAEVAASLEGAIATTKEVVPGASQHLLQASVDLRRGDWSGSVRNSIHAVEATATVLAPESNTLGKALNALDQKGHIHGGLKAAFSQLYGYTSDDEGIRHALVFKDSPTVDESDALFMLGACSSFVSYLLSKGAAAGLIGDG